MDWLKWTSSRQTCLPGFWQTETQTSLISCRDLLENWNFTCSKSSCKKWITNADQTADVEVDLRLCCLQTAEVRFSCHLKCSSLRLNNDFNGKRMQKCIRKGINIFKMFVSGDILSILSNIRSEIMFLRLTWGSTLAQWWSAWLETEGPRVRASPESLSCVLEQDTFILA